MATTTQYNPNAEMNALLLKCGASKTVYALVTPETEEAKSALFYSVGDGQDPNQSSYFEMFRGAWTGKQDVLHENFFSTWVDWSEPVVKFYPQDFPFYYPTAGASEALRHIIFDLAAQSDHSEQPVIHIFRGEYEGYKAMAEAAGLTIQEWDRADWRDLVDRLNDDGPDRKNTVFLSQPSAIDGNIWHDCNAFTKAIKVPDVVVMDVTYVGAVPFVREKFDLTQKCIRNVVFSLSKPFGAYYDRIGGVWCRKEDAGLFGNKWFKNLTSLALGVALMQQNDVFKLPRRYLRQQEDACQDIGLDLSITLVPSDVFILATAQVPLDDNPNTAPYDPKLVAYLRRPADGPVRLCLTPLMAEMIGTHK